MALCTCIQQDENNKRGNWSGRFDFFFSCLGYVVGLGSIGRFPYLCYKHGGVAYLIPYVIMLVCVGIPMFMLELALGQFTSCGPLTCWKYAPIFQGIGLGMVALTAIVAIYYNMLIGWSLYYLFASFSNKLPWAKCREEWDSPMCMDNVPVVEHCGGKNGTTYDDGTCRLNGSNGTITALWNVTLARGHGIERILPAKEYFDREVLGSYWSDGLGDLGPMRWKIVLCYLLAFILVALALSKSIKSLGKVMYFTVTIPYIALIILLWQGLTMDGHQDGIDLYTTPKYDKLSDIMMWKDAAEHVFFSLYSCWGILTTLASYNRFHSDIVTHSLAVPIINCITNVFAGFVVFSYIGSLSKEIQVPIDHVAEHGGLSLMYVVIPYALTKCPNAQFLAIVFFLMLVTLGIGGQFVLVETVLTSLMDCFPKLRRHTFKTVLIICTVLFLLGLTMTTNGGIYMVQLVDIYSEGWSITFIAFCELLSLIYVYGVRRYLTDIATMVCKTVCGSRLFTFCKYWWTLSWCLLTPVGVGLIMVHTWQNYKDIEGPFFPGWSVALGWMITVTPIVCIFIGVLFSVLATDGSLSKRLRAALTPNKDWGPALVQHRELVALYTPGYTVDPWSSDENDPTEASPDNIELQAPYAVTYIQNVTRSRSDHLQF